MNAVSKRKSKGMSPPSILTNCPNNIFKSFLDIAKIIFQPNYFFTIFRFLQFLAFKGSYGFLIVLFENFAQIYAK